MAGNSSSGWTSKTLFGRISEIRWKGQDYLVTAHFGKDYDGGSLSVRQFKSLDDMPVVFSLFQVK